VVKQGRKHEVLRYATACFGAVSAPASPARHGVLSDRKKRAAAPLIVLRRVTVTARRTGILSNVNWTICRGQNWAVFGPNGAGKTTLLNLIQGDHPQAHAQEISWFGKRADSPSTIWQARRRIGWMSPELHAHYSPEWPVLDVVCSGYFNSIGLFESCSKRQQTAARQWLRDFGLATQEQLPFGSLSMGQQRLVLLARAVVKQPLLLLLDEPLQSLDAVHRHGLLAAVDRVVEQTGAALVFATHLRKELPRCITHVLKLKAGRVVFRGNHRRN